MAYSMYTRFVSDMNSVLEILLIFIILLLIIIIIVKN